MPSADPSLSLAQRIDSLCDRFEADWKAGRRADVDAYLQDVPAAEQDAFRSALNAVRKELETNNRSVDSSVSQDSERTGAYQPSRSIPERIGRFEILALLGEGAFGRVYKARDPQLDRDVAIKVPKLEAFAGQFDLQRFLREAKSAAAIQHPNICPVHEVNVEGDQPYIVMAFIPGRSLAENLKSRSQPLPPKQAALIVRKLALALQVAHDKGIVHRDLKPANILFDPQRKDVVITDFGLAVRTSGGDVRETRSGMLLGTPAYMSPEQARGDVKQVGPASDLFALGVILYELLTNQRPFQGSLGEVIGQIQHVEPPSVRTLNPQLDERLDAICRQAMAKNPADRFPSMKALAAALDAYLRDQPTAATTTQKAKDADPEQSVGMAQVLAALSADRRAETEAAVEAAVRRVKPPTKLFVLIGLLIVGSITALGGIIFFTRTPTATVMIHIDVDLNDKTLSFFLDGKQVPAESLQAPIELKVGTHELIVKRGEEVIRKFTFTVSRDAGPRIELRDESPPKKEPPQSVISPPADIDHNAAIKVLQLRGIVTVQVGDKEIVVNGRDQHEPFDQLPKEPFQITQIDLRNDQRRVLPTDSLKPLAGLRHLKRLTLEGAEIGGNGIRPLAGLTTLEFLNLDSCRLTDADLVHLKDLANLTELSLSWNQLTGTGFVHLKGLTKLKLLSLYATQTNDDNLAHLYDLPELERLVVHQCQVTGKTFPNFKTWPRWKAVYLRGGPPSSKDLLPHLKTNLALEELALNMAWTDDDLAHLATNKALRILEIDQGGAITNRGLAYLSGLTNMQGVLLKDSQITDEGLDHLLTWKNLGRIHLPPAITHRGVAKLRAIKTLRVLGWRSATDEGMVYMKDFPNLKELWLNNAKITDAGLKHLHGLPKLIEIGLKNTAVTTAGIQALKESYKGRWFQVFVEVVED